MSDTTPTPNDAAIEHLRERVRQLEADIAMHRARMEGATMIRDDYLDTIATLSRKSRPRKVRAVPEAANDAAEAPRQTVFAAPCGSDVGEAA
jgi:hypothetical protein